MPDEPTIPPAPPPQIELPPFPDGPWRSIFAPYRDLIEPISECPLPYHYAAMLSKIAAEFGDMVKLVEGVSTYLNFFIFCNGRSGTKKSTAVELIDEHLIMRLPERRHSLFTAMSSAEGLIRVLRDAPNVLLYYDEIADLFSTAARTGQRLEPNLNKAFNLLPLSAPVKRESESLYAENYCLSIYANGTPDHVRLQLTEEMFTGGLLNRFLVFACEPGDKFIPRMRLPEQAACERLAAHLYAIIGGWKLLSVGRGSIVVDWTEEAEAVHAEWYIRHSMEKREMKDANASTLTRLDVYAKKIAAVYCLLETVPCVAPILTADHMRAALEVIGYCQQSMLWTVKDWTGPKSRAQQGAKNVEQRIEAWLMRHGCQSERVVYRALSISGVECKCAVDVLVEQGIIDIVNDRPRMLHVKGRCGCFPGMPMPLSVVSP